jgi:hypothetical protein
MRLVSYQMLHMQWKENIKRTADLFTGNQNTDSTPKCWVRRRSHRLITYAGQYGGTEWAGWPMNCNIQTFVIRWAPATGQLDQGVPCFSSVLEQMLSWHASHAALPILTSKFCPTVALQMLDQNVSIMQPFQHKKKLIAIIRSKTPAQLFSCRLHTSSLPKASPSQQDTVMYEANGPRDTQFQQ